MGARSSHRCTPTRPPANTARFVFLDPHAAEFFRAWDNVANDTVAVLRAEAGRDPYDKRLSDLIGELSTRSQDFRAPGAANNVRIHSSEPGSPTEDALNLLASWAVTAERPGPAPSTGDTQTGVQSHKRE